MMETFPLLLSKPQTSCQATCPPGAPIQPAVPGRATLGLYIDGFLSIQLVHDKLCESPASHLLRSPRQGQAEGWG